MSTWKDLREELVVTFKRQVNEKLVIQTLQKSRPERDNTIQYIADGLPGDAMQKVTLYACRNYSLLVNLMEAYETAYRPSRESRADEERRTKRRPQVHQRSSGREKNTDGQISVLTVATTVTKGGSARKRSKGRSATPASRRDTSPSIVHKSPTRRA